MSNSPNDSQTLMDGEAEVTDTNAQRVADEPEHAAETVTPTNSLPSVAASSVRAEDEEYIGSEGGSTAEVEARWESRIPPAQVHGEDGDDGGELSDNVGSDVRNAPTAPPTSETLEGGGENERGESGPRTRSAGSQTDSRNDADDEENALYTRDETEAAMAAEAAQGMNPSQGVQVDAEADLPAPAAADDDDNRANRAAEAATPVADSTATATALVQAAVGTVVVNTTLLPMQCHTYLTLPVSRAVKNSRLSNNGVADGGRGERAVGVGEGCWLLLARGLYEAMATRLCVHPQSFHIYHNGERVRFNHTIVLEVDRTTTTTTTTAPAPAPAYGTSEDDPLGLAGLSAGCTRAEPLWITVVFVKDEEQEDDVTAEEEERRNHAPDGAGEMGRGDSGVPSHLASLHAGEVLERCLLVRRAKPALRPQSLVEGLRNGLRFDDVIQQSYTCDRGVAGEETTAIVAVLRAADFTHKPFLGGYRVREDPGRLLLHASTQLFMKDLSYSPFPKKRVPVEDTCSRQTQTYGISRSCQTARECCVQTPSFMESGRVMLDSTHDYVVVARPYFSAAQLHELRVGKAIVLQKMYRQWKARQVRRALEDVETDKQQRAEERQRTEEAAQRARESRAHLRRADPRTAADFDELRKEIMQWRSTEAARVTQDATLTTRERQAALLAITKEEVKMLQEWEHRRRLTLLERKDQQFSVQLARTAADKVWGTSGVHVTTPQTVRAGELKDLYESLTNHAASIDARLDILLHVKWTVKEFETAAVSEELLQLIDREADLLHRGRREASLSGLRKRIEALFRQFLEDPTFNPAMAPFTTTAVGRAKARGLGLDGMCSTAGCGGGASNEGVPHGGYTAAKCASCAQQLRAATLLNGRRRRQHQKQHGEEASWDEGVSLASGANTYHLGNSNGNGGSGFDGDEKGGKPIDGRGMVGAGGSGAGVAASLSAATATTTTTM